MILEDVTLPFRAGFVDFITVLAVEVLGCLQNWQVELRDRAGGHIGVSLGQVVDQHPSPLEAKHAGLTFVNESVQLSRRNLEQYY